MDQVDHHPMDQSLDKRTVKTSRLSHQRTELKYEASIDRYV